MPRPEDAIHRHAQPRQRTQAGVDGFKGTALPGSATGPEHDTTLVGVVGASKVGQCKVGPPGWCVVGQSKVGSGDVVAPQPADWVKRARVGFCFVGSSRYEVQ